MSQYTLFCNSAIKAADYLSQYLIDDIMNPIISKN